MTAALQFPANDIRLEGLEVDAHLDANWLDAALADAGLRARRGGEEGVRVTGRLSRSDDNVVVRCKIVAHVEADCVRCLGPSPSRVAAELSLLLEPAKPLPGPGRAASGRGRAQEAEEEYEFGAEEAEVDTFDGERVVLDAFVREAILLEMPNFPLCSEACPGIRPAPVPHELPDAPAPVDPRLAPLGQFRKQLGGPATLEELVAAAAERSAAMGRPVMRQNAHRTTKKKK